jgi:hypothetical protein
MSTAKPSSHPYRLSLAAACLALILLVTPFKTAQSPVVIAPSLAVYDIFLGMSGFIIMGYTSIWLWQHGRGWRAAAGTSTALTLLIVMGVIRSLLFAQADYERGRVFFGLSMVVFFVAVTVWLRWAAASSRD